MKKTFKIAFGAVFLIGGMQLALAGTTCWKCTGDPNGAHECVKISCPIEAIK